MAYLHPGVYIEEIPSGSKPIEGVGTSTAAFVGYTTKGPIGEPELISKWDNYDTQFGGIQDSVTKLGDPMGFSVSAFFQNGGGKAYIVRITKDWNTDDTPVAFNAVKAWGFMDHPDTTNTTDGLVFTAINEGKWGNELVVQVSANTDFPGLYIVQIGSKNLEGEFFSDETFADVSLDAALPNYIESIINDVSEIVTVEMKTLADIVTDAGTNFRIGTLTSAVIDPAATSLDLSGATEPNRTLEITIDGTGVNGRIVPIVLPQQDYTDTGLGLDELAAEIEKQVRGSASVTHKGRKGFICVADGNMLILTSGTHDTSTDAQVAIDETDPLAAVLNLRVADTASSTTGGTISGDLSPSWIDISASEREVQLSTGLDGSQPDLDDYRDVFTKFLKYRDINIICLPGQAWASDGSGNPVIDAAIGHASKMKSRMVIVDPPVDTELETPKQVNDLTLPSQTYSVLYYPWIKVANPFYNAETNPGALKTMLVPPSGFAAGMWAKIDGKRGVWKAPAGMESGLLGVAGLQYTVEDAEQDSLNPLGINCLRKMPGAGRVLWGARTLATKADPEWRYVPVRRTAIMIEQSIYGGIQWAVFEPNDHRLWSSLRGNIDGFMNSLFRVGAFQGGKASDAYFVRCGLGDTMTQAEIDAGQVIVIVGFAPLKPAEFVIVRIQQKVNQQ